MSYRKVRPHPHEKTLRNAAIVKYATDNADNAKSISREMGKLFGLSASRINIILRKWKSPEVYGMPEVSDEEITDYINGLIEKQNNDGAEVSD